MLTGFGLPASLAVWVGSLRGVGQSSARIWEILFGRRIHPLTLNLLGVLLLPVCFAAGLLSGRFVVAAVALAFLSGAGNGILAITRGTLPLVLFDPRTYGAVTGRLLVPSLVLSAAAPITLRLRHRAARRARRPLPVDGARLPRARGRDGPEGDVLRQRDGETLSGGAGVGAVSSSSSYVGWMRSSGTSTRFTPLKLKSSSTR